jgi:hypothetical protein
MSNDRLIAPADAYLPRSTGNQPTEQTPQSEARATRRETM